MEETGQVYATGLYGRVIGVTAKGKNYTAKEYNIPEPFITNCGFHSSFNHRNIIEFIGCHYQPMLLVVLEQMEMNFNKVMGLPNLSYSIKLSILHDISEGILYLHGRSPAIVHCDISPRHILFTKSLCAKINALNFCTVAGGYTSKPKVSPTQNLFNPPELNPDMKPEENGAVSPEFDVYSFGMMCACILLGLEKIQTAYNYSVQFDLSGLDKEVGDLIKKCLNFDKSARPSSKIVAQEMKKLSVQTPRRLKDIIEAINPTTDFEVLTLDSMHV
jgi:serine/threonine protein kinase